MATRISYSYARQNLAQILRDAEDSQEPVIITRRGHGDMALIPADEYRSLEQTAHLLRSPKNAQRLLQALHRSLTEEAPPQTSEGLKAELGLE